MSEISLIVVDGFKPIVKTIISNYKAKGMKASGEFEQSLEIVEIPNGAVIMGAGHAVQLEFGRGATSSGSSSGNETLFERIEQWIKDKGIIATDISEQSLIFLITRKIHNEGWDRSKHGGVKLISDSITESDFQKIIDSVMELQIRETKNNLIEILKR